MPVAGVLVARLEPPLSTSRRRSCVAPGRPTRHARSTGHVTCPGFPDGRGWVAVMSLRSRRGGQQTRSGSIGMRREGGQVRAAEAGRRGSVGHVEVFRMDGVGTSVVGRPRRLSADRRARPTYTLIWEEPLDVLHVVGLDDLLRQGVDDDDDDLRRSLGRCRWSRGTGRTGCGGQRDGRSSGNGRDGERQGTSHVQPRHQADGPRCP